MEKYYHSYNTTYTKFAPDWFDDSNQVKRDLYIQQNSESLIKFLDSFFKQREYLPTAFKGKKVLVLGCGFGGVCHYFAKKGSIVTGIDIAPLAIAGAKEIAHNKNLAIEYIAADLCHYKTEQKYDFVVDDHLLHCLATPEDRKNYLQQVLSYMQDDALYILETMALQNNVRTPIGYRLDENGILWQDKTANDKAEEVMIRCISTAIEIENELVQAGFKIDYLYYHSELAFQVFSEYTDYPFEFLPRTLRVGMIKQ